MTYEIQTNMTQPCGECPFRKTSPAGWLGPWTAEEIVEIAKYEPFACHRTIPDGFEPEEEDPWDHTLMEHCVGATILLNNSYALSLDELVREHQEKLKELPEEAKQAIFTWPHEFVAHHKRGAA